MGNNQTGAKAQPRSVSPPAAEGDGYMDFLLGEDPVELPQRPPRTNNTRGVAEETSDHDDEDSLQGAYDDFLFGFGEGNTDIVKRDVDRDVHKNSSFTSKPGLLQRAKNAFQGSGVSNFREKANAFKMSQSERGGGLGEYYHDRSGSTSNLADSTIEENSVSTDRIGSAYDIFPNNDPDENLPELEDLEVVILKNENGVDTQYYRDKEGNYYLYVEDSPERQRDAQGTGGFGRNGANRIGGATRSGNEVKVAAKEDRTLPPVNNAGRRNTYPLKNEEQVDLEEFMRDYPMLMEAGKKPTPTPPKKPALTTTETGVQGSEENRRATLPRRAKTTQQED
ncbi:hypothetical protein ADEAN_000103000 [Angomonas deanei]|uniref:Uncharacterized protein n=1 Tax=Angomonas deanei TaxID=59799 RepID=A0A7G2C4C3_9TRYP|nr:hypothetical protein ADEAN_000103000 [Angomonas deanei]